MKQSNQINGGRLVRRAHFAKLLPFQDVSFHAKVIISRSLSAI